MDYNSIKNQIIKDKFVAREIYLNATETTEYILSKSNEGSEAPFSFDEITNYHSYPEFIEEYANFNGGTFQERQKEIEKI